MPKRYCANTFEAMLPFSRGYLAILNTTLSLMPRICYEAILVNHDSGIGLQIEKGKADFEKLEKYTLENGEPKLQSGRQELLENILNDYI